MCEIFTVRIFYCTEVNFAKANELKYLLQIHQINFSFAYLKVFALAELKEFFDGVALQCMQIFYAIILVGEGLFNFKLIFVAKIDEYVLLAHAQGV